MAESRVISRRAMIIGSVALAGGSILTLTLRWSRWTLPGSGGSAREEVIEIRLGELLGSGKPIRQLGRRYLDRFPDEAETTFLVSQLFGELPEASTASARDVAEHFRRAVEDDFERNAVEHLDGWILSKSELRLCALVSLL